MLAASDRPTAIFACSDVMALGVYDAARDLGLDIPADLSVVGFDDVPESEWATPAITTVRQPVAEMGAEAVGLLFQARRQAAAPDPSAPARVELSTTLVPRGSSAPPPCVEPCAKHRDTPKRGAFATTQRRWRAAHGS